MGDLIHFASTIDCLAARWKGAAAILPGFAVLAEGAPVPLETLAAACAVELDELKATLKVIRHGCDEHGRVIDLYGMTLHPTRHELTFGHGQVYSCCALWAHVIPKLVGRTALVRSIDPVDGKKVELQISPDGVEAIAPETAMGTMAVATEDAVSEDVGAAFCSHVNHVGSREHAEQFSREQPNRYFVEIAEFNELAKMLVEAITAAFLAKQ